MGQQDNPGASRYSRARRAQSEATTATWEDVSPDLLWRAATAVVATGDALMLSKTRDGGALVLTLLHDKERVTLYGSTGEKMDLNLREVIADLADD